MLLVWKAPRPANADEAAELVRAWYDAGGRAGGPGHPDTADPARNPFEASDDVRWFSREITNDLPALWNPDAPPKLEGHPTRLVVVELDAATAQEALENVYGAAMKYDLIVYDPQRGIVSEPLKEMGEYASATFWPRGAIQALVAGGGGAMAAVVAWFLGIPIVSGIVVIVGAFMAAMAVLTFVAEGRKRLGKDGSSAGGSSAGGNATGASDAGTGGTGDRSEGSA